ncbi:hypothetical protein U9K52_01160 [Chryseobacterium sp. MHB01]|uniref:hypothetical protein n=1 Tax=Chryseobacterium sp. MHB01 TaxID=3109433 RepID=UPI002AFEFAE8|nr:hypothetical protein [Chryseobacterium sp. MHB01]MEA1847507.1 hypothetical protein [Chryseobacterium sp. MHB01]
MTQQITYKAFIGKKKLFSNLLEALDLIEVKSWIAKIDFAPDFRILEYDRHTDKEYYFTNKLKFDNDHNFVIDCKFSDQFVFSYDRFNDIEENEDFLFTDKDDIEYSVNELDSLRSDLLEDYKFDTEFDGFKLNNLKDKYINNTKKEIHYEGGVFGSPYHIVPDFWELFSMINVTAIKKNHIEFYKDLLGESYVLKLEGNYKLSFFLLYSALESFVNLKLQNERGRLFDKINELFKIETDTEDLNNNEIYSSVLSSFNIITDQRNTIVHGKNTITISENNLNKFFISVLTYMVSIQFKCKTFEEILQKI